MNWLARLQAWLRPDPATVVNAAITRAAQLAGELEEARARAEYYRILLTNCDPNNDWWRWAQLKERQHCAQEDCLDLSAAYERACLDVDSLITAQRERE